MCVLEKQLKHADTISLPFIKTTKVSKHADGVIIFELREWRSYLVDTNMILMVYSHGIETYTSLWYDLD